MIRSDLGNREHHGRRYWLLWFWYSSIADVNKVNCSPGLGFLKTKRLKQMVAMRTLMKILVPGRCKMLAMFPALSCPHLSGCFLGIFQPGSGSGDWNSGCA